MLSLRRSTFLWALVWMLALAPSNVFGRDAVDEPICTIAAVSSPYITTLSAKELGERGWIEKVAPAGLERTIAAANRLKPDALVILGSLTWTGSEADFRRLKSFVDRVDVPIYLVPGQRDFDDGGAEHFGRVFPEQTPIRRSVRIRNVHLQFAAGRDETASEAEREMLDWMEQDLEGGDDPQGVLLFEGPHFPALPRENRKSAPQAARRYWDLIHQHKVAVRFTSGHAHTVTCQETLPVWSIPSSGWSYSPKWLLALIAVYSDRIELNLLREPGQPPQRLVVPNPVAGQRMPLPADDPYLCPTYSEDLARKPELTFVQLSDSQFDDKTLERYRALYHYDEQNSQLVVRQVNRLKPALVFMTGDLTNKNTPAEWKTFRRIYSRLTPTLHPLPGNHDTLYDRGKLTREALGDLLETGRANWTLADRLAGGQAEDRALLFRHFTRRKPYYTVEKNGCAFLCLNTGVASVDSEQMNWLRQELERTKDYPHVFVLGHYPVLKQFGGNVQGAEADEILMLLHQYKVTAYLSGHRHRYDYRVHEGTPHILCDCLCWGEYRSYQIYHVFPDRIVACRKPFFREDGNRPLYERVVFPERRYKGPASE